MAYRKPTREEDERLLEALALREEGKSVAAAAEVAGVSPRALRAFIGRVERDYARSASDLSGMKGVYDQTK